MGNKVFSTETIELQDWDGEIELRPLTIKNLRKVYKKIEELSKGQSDDVTMLDIMLEAVAISMQQFCPPLADVDKLADHVDMPTLEHILEVAAGIKLNDPNLQAAAMAAANGTKG